MRTQNFGIAIASFAKWQSTSDDQVILGLLELCPIDLQNRKKNDQVYSFPSFLVTTSCMEHYRCAFTGFWLVWKCFCGFIKKKSGNLFIKSFSPTYILIQCSEPGQLIKCSSRLQPIEAVFSACAVSLCTTAISKYGGGRRQCCEAVSLSLIAVRVKTNAEDIVRANTYHVVAGLMMGPI